MAQNWAICIGVNQYNNLTPLKYAVGDAGQMQDFLRQELGFNKVYLFTDNSPAITDAGKPFASQPTYGNLRRFLRIRFDKPFLGAGDNLWFFFSGHGLRHGDRDYLMPTDGDPHPEGIQETAISLNYVTERLRRCGADNVVLFLDACRNEGGKGLGIGEEKQKGVITLYSCSPGEISYEIEQLKQGSFTHALLESLRIQGEGNCATVERLNQRLQYRVSQINQQYKKPKQIPYPTVEPASKYHLILLPKQATLQDIANLKIDAQDAELEGNLTLAIQLWKRILAVSPGDDQAFKSLERIWRKPQTNTHPTTTVPSNKAGAKTQEKSSFLKTFQFEVITVNEKGEEINRRPGQAEYFTEDLGNGITLEMVSIPGGKFLMGTGDEEIEKQVKKYNSERFRTEEPQHQVTIKPFFMGKFPVTQAQWKAVAALPKISCELKSKPSYFQGGSLPVERIYWHQAKEFCARLSKHTGREYQLPSEAQWEYACRAGTTTPFHFGDIITTDLVNYDGNRTYRAAPKGEYRKQTTPVGSFPPNAFGLYDMQGNVREWCVDHFSSLRTGSWDDYPRLYRYGTINERIAFFVCNNNTGFRVVCAVSRTS